MKKFFIILLALVPVLVSAQTVYIGGSYIDENGKESIKLNTIILM